MPLTSFGITETTLRVTQSLNVGGVLKRVVKPRAAIQLGSYVEDEGKALFNLTKEKGMEAIIAKRKMRRPVAPGPGIRTTVTGIRMASLPPISTARSSLSLQPLAKMAAFR